MSEGFRSLPPVFRVCVAVGLAFALTQVEAAYDRHRDFAPVARAEERAADARQQVESLPYDVVEGWLRAGVVESEVRERWRSGNAAFAEAYGAVADRTPQAPELRGERCYVFPVTGEVRTRIRGTVALAAFCYEGEAPATAPLVAGLEPVTDA
ncbi:hypothetical protein G7072_11960 [Nocardioides sp. HDW12B]|uniref:hypothetical protein n=1 Tax=Nocardioides sp. HDW12B TaxID=2714939 RepID=UPI001408BAF9|nr:hypothetical protein [Nocardioides sp. HDW12B]QIK66960.1 hypothetical protein G7072_11960 [Nocardioides sp. HDW12B]